MTATVPRILWQPSERAVEEAQLTQFARQVVRKRRLELNSYPDFYRWSVEQPEEFWSDTWDFCGVLASRKGATVLVDGDKMPGARWFPEARLNLAENLLRRGDRGDAFVFWDETGPRRELATPTSTATSRARRRRCRARIARRRPGRGVHSQHPESGHARARRAVAGHRVVFVLAGFRRRRACSIASARSSRRCCSAPTATATTARRHDSLERVARSSRSCRRCARSWSCRTSTAKVDVSDIPKAVTLENGCAATGPPTSSSRSCPSTTRCSSSSPRARPASPSASCTAPAARCCRR